MTMKIVLVCRVYPTQRPGGMGFVCQDRARELAKQGHEVHVLTTGTGRPNHKYDQAEPDQGAVVHHLDCKPESYSDEFAKECVSTCWKLQPDIVHLDSFDNRRPWWQDLQGKATTGITMHGFCWGTWMTKVNLAYRDRQPAPTFSPEDFERERRLLQTVNRVIGISLHEHWLLRQMMGLFDARLVYNPIAPYFFENHTDPPNKKRYLSAAISGHSERGWNLAKRAADKAGVELILMSTVDREKMPMLIDSCDGYILPTAYAQGYDLAVCETLARRRRVLVTATGSYLREGEESLLFTLLPLIDLDGSFLASALCNLPPDPPPFLYDSVSAKHRPEIHILRWLEAMQ